MIGFSVPRKINGLLGAGLLQMLLLLGASLAPTALYAEFMLGQGDRVKVMVAGLSSLDFEATISEDGTVDFAWIGNYPAVGRSVAELERDVQADAEGKIIKQYDRDGNLFIIQLESEDVHLVRTAYKPVVVSGSVVNPGEIQFTPGMTVREAVALAGGADNRLLAIDTTLDASQVVRWQGDYGAAALDQAEAFARRWRIEAEISQDYASERPGGTTTAVSEETFGQILVAQQQIMAVNRQTENGERAYFEQAKYQAVQRIEILRLQQEKLREALAADEEEEARVNSLVERGLAPGSRISDVRRSTVLSATRLLELEDALSRIELEVIRLDRQVETYEEQRLQVLLGAQQQAERDLRGARLRMDIASQYLAMAGADIATSDIIAEFDVVTTIHRTENGKKTELAADLDSRLVPGDTLEIAFEEVANMELTE